MKENKKEPWTREQVMRAIEIAVSIANLILRALGL